MKKRFLRYISFLLTMVILSNTTTTTLSPVITISAEESVLIVEDRTEAESKEDAKTLKSITGDWNKAKKDCVVPPYGQFHKEVQKYIINKNLTNGISLSDEQMLTFKEGLYPVGNKTGKGRADLYLWDIDNKTSYFWEVKPGSYLIPSKMTEGFIQLGNYVEDTVLETGITQHRYGNVCYPEGVSYVLEGALSLADVLVTFSEKLGGNIDLEQYKGLDISFDITLDDSKKYMILIAYLPSGLILYWFIRIPDSELSNSPQIPNLLPFWWLFGVPFLELWRQTNQNSNGSQNPPAAPAFSSDKVTPPKTNPFPNPSEDWGAKPSTETPRANYSRDECSPINHLFQFLTSPDAIFDIVGGALIVTVAAIVAEKLSSVKPSYAASMVLTETISVEECLDIFIKPALTNDQESYQELEKYIYSDYENCPICKNKKEDDDFTAAAQSKAKEFDKAAKAQPPRDPLIIDLGKQGIELTTLDNGVNFDMDNNTFAEKTAWIGLEDGFLVLDRNDNGKIDNGGELFGDQVILKSGLNSTSGFEALMEFDENKDGVIDKKDAIYSSLKVWIDENHNGISESNELKTLIDLGISSINLKSTQEGKIDTVTGTREASSSEVVFKNGTKKKISEFWFPVDLSNTTQDGNTTSGNVPTITKAIEADETGELMILYLCFEYTNVIAFKKILS